MRKTLSYISLIRERSNRFIVEELESRGISGIVSSHGEILVLLYRHGSMMMSELAEKMNRTKPTITVLVDKLVANGYVTKQRSTEDSRVWIIGLTPKGEDFKTVFFDISRKLNQRLHAGLSSDEADQLESLLSRIVSGS